MANVTKKPLCSVMEGVIYASQFSPKCFAESLHYKPRNDDVFIATYPKCGTTWMQNLVLYIFRKGEEMTDFREYFRQCPFIEMLGQEGINRMIRPGALKTHLPYDKMPYSPEAKYIYVARNPKDCCVSFYHHTRSLPGFGYWDGKFDDFFELFMTGEVEFNDYFDHLLGWFPHRFDKNAFYTTYEDMQRDIEEIVVKLANFLGKEYGQLIERDNTVLKNIIQYSSFEYMKKNINPLYNRFTNKDHILKDPNALEGIKHIVQFVDNLNPPKERPHLEFVRKGKVGDWRTYFSDEQCERLQKRFDEKFQGTDIPSLWSSDILQ